MSTSERPQRPVRKGSLGVPPRLAQSSGDASSPQNRSASPIGAHVPRRNAPNKALPAAPEATRSRFQTLPSRASGRPKLVRPSPAGGTVRGSPRGGGTMSGSDTPPNARRGGVRFDQSGTQTLRLRNVREIFRAQEQQQSSKHHDEQHGGPSPAATTLSPPHADADSDDNDAGGSSPRSLAQIGRVRSRHNRLSAAEHASELRAEAQMLNRKSMLQNLGVLLDDCFEELGKCAANSPERKVVSDFIDNLCLAVNELVCDKEAALATLRAELREDENNEDQSMVASPRGDTSYEAFAARSPPPRRPSREHLPPMSPPVAHISPPSSPRRAGTPLPAIPSKPVPVPPNADGRVSQRLIGSPRARRQRSPPPKAEEPPSAEPACAPPPPPPMPNSVFYKRSSIRPTRASFLAALSDEEREDSAKSGSKSPPLLSPRKNELTLAADRMNRGTFDQRRRRSIRITTRRQLKLVARKSKQEPGGGSGLLAESGIDRKFVEDMEREEAQMKLRLEKELEQRALVAREILTTERNYVHALDVLVKVFMRPLQSAATSESPILDERSVQVLFAHVQVLLGYSHALLTELEERIDNWSNDQTLADVFLSLTSYLRAYSPYLKNYNAALSVLTDSMKIPAFKTFLNSKKVRSAIKLQDLSDFLVMPVQRVPRYVMLLESLLKYTPSSHPDHAPLERAVELTRNVCEENNASQREAEQLQEILQIQRKIGKRLFVPGRKLIDKDELQVVRQGAQLTAQLFLFNDVLVYAKRSKFKHQWPLHAISVVESSSSDVTFYVTHSSNTFEFVTSSPVQCSGWIDAIRKASHDSEHSITRMRSQSKSRRGVRKLVNVVRKPSRARTGATSPPRRTDSPSSPKDSPRKSRRKHRPDSVRSSSKRTSRPLTIHKKSDSRSRGVTTPVKPVSLSSSSPTSSSSDTVEQ